MFKKLLNFWQDYNIFISSHAGQPVSDAIDGYKRLIEQERERAREEEAALRQADLLLAQEGSRFETEQERTERLAKERELEEFGSVGISFCLANPNPDHTYCGLMTSLNYKTHPELPRPSSSQLELMYEVEKRSGKLERSRVKSHTGHVRTHINSDRFHASNDIKVPHDSDIKSRAIDPKSDDHKRHRHATMPDIDKSGYVHFASPLPQDGRRRVMSSHASFNEPHLPILKKPNQPVSVY